MARWTPDPTFYPSPRSAIEAPQEELAYVVALDATYNGGGYSPTRPDQMTVVGS